MEEGERQPSPAVEGPSPSLPDLPYKLMDHKKGWTLVAIIWFLDSCLMPITLFYALWFGTSLQKEIIFAVITSAWGFVNYGEFSMRFLKLLKKDPFYRPLGSHRRWFDTSQYIFTLVIACVTIELIVGTAFSYPLVRLLAMPGPTILFSLGGCICTLTLLHLCHVKAPFRISSVPKGAPIRPAVYTLMEDIAAVDCNAGRPYREALNARYEASPKFRSMLLKVSIFWSVSTLAIAAALTAVVFTVPDTVSYGIAWAVPFTFVLIGILMTIHYVDLACKEERRTWGEKATP